ncbi:PREDICTED: RNA exonuclease 3 isoform X2 [Vollenhovia emeryi]|nr:PREDICTED: RNA exonuclease 3 isoform X2 [Vollenhovia emeryi]
MQPREFGSKRAKNKKRREAQQERVQHPWMTGTLKGHTAVVNDMDFSSNGKYLASCADDENSRETRKHVQSSGQCHAYKKKESKKKTPRTSSSLQADREESLSSVGRGDKETGKASRSRSRDSSRIPSQRGTVSGLSSPEASTSDTSSNGDILDARQCQTTLSYYDYLALTLRNYVLSPAELYEHGYPVESSKFPGYAMIHNVLYPVGPKSDSDSGQYSNSSSSDNSEQDSSSDNGDNETSPVKEKGPDDKNSSGSDGGCDSERSSDNKKSPDDKQNSESEKCYDSGSNSGSEESPENKKSSEHKKNCSRKGSSSSNSSDDEVYLDKKSLDKEKIYDNESSSDSEKGLDSKKEFCKAGNTKLSKRTCARCQKVFTVNENGEYTSTERCIYHHGKLYNRMFDNGLTYWTCCHQDGGSRGCVECRMHVWTGLFPGINQPLEGYVSTMQSPYADNQVYALDCEMCFTLQGLELARVTIVNLDCEVVYDEHVKPSSEVIDYNTRFSGITEESMLRATKTLPDVQNDLLGLIYAETILMGHSLANDLKALRMIHKNVVDTSALYPHYRGLPYRNGLKTLARKHLDRTIQEETHDSCEDARVVVELVVKKIQSERENSGHFSYLHA